ncbi:MAG: hypothetical protein DMG57_23240 [Acidobacteria bacterium]|nr:MAG: hypothetical protein DMG57_23240 [Acidobacteriota bacterium]
MKEQSPSCFFREIGCWVGVQFSPDKKWSQRQFRPKHMLDLKKLLTDPPLLPPRATLRLGAAQATPRTASRPAAVISRLQLCCVRK